MDSISEVVTVHSGEEPPGQWTASLFLAGPTPRSDEVASWRPEALAGIRRRWNQPGRLVVFVPEPRDGTRWPDYDANRAWELRWGDRADVVLFWMARDMRTMPALTSATEWGLWHPSGRVVLGTPAEAERVRYTQAGAAEHHVPTTDTLPEAIQLALDHIGAGALRAGGHRDVPLLVWRTASFASWLATQEGAGNELRGGRLDWTFRMGPTKQIVVFWAFHAQIYVAAEDRIKDNEVVISRPDIAAVVAYRHGATLHDTKIALVREFRSPGASKDGFVRELPGGSGLRGDPIEQAVAEVSEEIGLTVHPEQLQVHAVRQPAATISAHRLHVFSVELTDDQLAQLENSTGTYGNADETERTCPEVTTVGQLLDNPDIDWTTLGAVFQVLSTSVRSASL